MQHTCGICGRTFAFEYQKGEKLPSNFPFCSARCKATDLQKWFNEEYRFSTELPNAEFMTEHDREVFAQFLVEAGEDDNFSDEEE